MGAGRRLGRYRLRTMLRGLLPHALADRIPKGTTDCGNHEWYRQDVYTDACYHCDVGHRRYVADDVADVEMRHQVGAKGRLKQV